MLATEVPYTIYFDKAGKPLDGGYLYFGAENDNPETNPLQVFWDPAGTQPVAQPVRTSAGFPLRSGVIAQIYSGNPYSVTVKDKSGTLVHYAASSASFALSNAVADVSSSVAALAFPAGSSGIGFIQAGASAGARTLQDKVRELVSVADFLPAGVTPSTATPTQATTAIQAALNSGARRVFISANYAVNGGVSVAMDNQVIDFDGGSLTAVAGTAATNGLIYVAGKKNIRIVDPHITASVADVLQAINLKDSPGSRIVEGVITGCFLNLEGSDPTARMGYKVRDTVVDLAGLQTTCVRVSGAKGVALVGVEMCNGYEGLGVYNAANIIREVACESYGHTHDCSVVIHGSKVVQLGNHHHECGQSGFTTQRQTAGTNTQDVVMIGNISDHHVADGFDLRGHDGSSASWNTDMRLVTVGNISTSNGGTGLFSPNAECQVHVGNIASMNTQAGHEVNFSDRNIIIGMISASNSGGAPTGTAKAGILFSLSPRSHAIGCVSGNSAGATQQYGISFTGANTDCSLVGGYYGNNASANWNIDTTSTVAVAATPIQTAAGVWLNYLNSQNGAGDYSGSGVPTFNAVKGSVYHRVDGAGGEIYICNGNGSPGVTIGNSWTQLTH